MAAFFCLFGARLPCAQASLELGQESWLKGAFFGQGAGFVE